MKENKIVVPLYYCRSRIPLVVFYYKEKPFVGLVDTGSEKTMLDFTMRDEGIEVKESNIETNFVGVNGEGGVDSVFDVDDMIQFKTKDDALFPVCVKGVLFDLSNISTIFQKKSGKAVKISAIIGSDFLKERNAKIDFKNKNLTVEV